jgi:hypothetical protein
MKMQDKIKKIEIDKLIEYHQMQCRECGGKETAKMHALITVDFILDALNKTERIQMHPIGVYKAQEHWNAVKQELELL